MPVMVQEFRTAEAVSATAVLPRGPPIIFHRLVGFTNYLQCIGQVPYNITAFLLHSGLTYVCVYNDTRSIASILNVADVLVIAASNGCYVAGGYDATLFTITHPGEWLIIYLSQH